MQGLVTLPGPFRLEVMVTTAAALAELTEWVRSGKLKYHEDMVEGFGNMPRALIGLFLGENIGKRVVKFA